MALGWGSPWRRRNGKAGHSRLLGNTATKTWNLFSPSRTLLLLAVTPKRCHLLRCYHVALASLSAPSRLFADPARAREGGRAAQGGRGRTTHPAARQREV